MKGLIAIDELGDLGQKGSRYFLMAAIITYRQRNLLKTYKSIPTRGDGRTKFYNASKKERIKVLREIANSNVNIVYVCVDKKNSTCFTERGNSLYSVALDKLLKLAFEVYPYKDIEIYIDESGFIKYDCFKN